MYKNQLRFVRLQDRRKNQDTIENIRNNEYKATFLIENYEQTQEEIEETEEYTILTNAEDSEFALLENNDVQIIGGINV